MVLALIAHALADDNVPSAMDIEECFAIPEALYPGAGDADVALDAVPAVLIASAECGGGTWRLLLERGDEVVSERAIDSPDPVLELHADLEPFTTYTLSVFEGDAASPELDATFTTSAAESSPPAAPPSILSGQAVQDQEGGSVYVSAELAAGTEATVHAAAPWDGVSEVGDPEDFVDASEARWVQVRLDGLAPGDDACVAATARGLDGDWSAATTECFVVTQGWGDEEMTWVDDHDHACNAASAAMGLAPILLGTLGILRRRTR
ncbi:MAG: hypothetical protein FJ102_08795 [Deltaproteobacteria bacterium]|nr:hypothetical protein [Deltaproteobacteria bacterium]